MNSHVHCGGATNRTDKNHFSKACYQERATEGREESRFMINEQQSLWMPIFQPGDVLEGIGEYEKWMNRDRTSRESLSLNFCPETETEVRIELTVYLEYDLLFA